MNTPPQKKVWFVGAGPGDPELITVKGQRLLSEADLIIYAGSLVPREIPAQANSKARLLDSSGLTLEETHAAIVEAVAQGLMVVRLHTGDAGLYGAMPEQTALLEADNIPYAVVPGVSAAFAAAAAAGVSLTVPEISQAFSIVRLEGRTPVPDGQKIRDFAAHGGSLAVYLSSAYPEQVAEELRKGGLPEDATVIIASRVGWPDEKIITSTVAGFAQAMKDEGISKQAVLLALPGEGAGNRPKSRLYDRDFSHEFRAAKDSKG